MATTRKKTKSTCGGKRKAARKRTRNRVGTLSITKRKPRTRRKALQGLW